MKLVIFSPILNHHQVPLADELYHLLGEQFVFVATRKNDAAQLKGGKDYTHRPYYLCAADSAEKYKEALQLIEKADVALISGGELEYEIARSKTNKLTFEVSERWLKRGWINLFSPTILKCFIAYWRHFHRKPVYKLCCSAFAAKDHYKLRTYPDRCFKWGYFTKVDLDYKLESPKPGASDSEITSLMWCARFLSWKHPELPVKLARRLKENGYTFKIDMYGDGVELENTKQLAKELDVRDIVFFHGSMPNEQILEQMRKHEIFLFTSDSNEGWGAVANEAMSNGCVLAGSDAIGSIPYLIRDGENGCIFRNMDIDSLFEKLKYLLDNPQERKRMASNACSDMRNAWSPAAAAQNLLTLISDIQAGRASSIQEGPGSIATPI